MDGRKGSPKLLPCEAKPLIDPAVSDSRIKSLAKRFSKAHMLNIAPQ